MNALTIIIPINDLIAEHNAKTGEKMTRRSLAEELHREGYYNSVSSAINTLGYHSTGRAKSLDKALEIYLCKRFDKPLSGIYITK